MAHFNYYELIVGRIMKQQKIQDIILSAVIEINQTLTPPVALTEGLHTPLYGKHGVFDSLALVTLIVAVEEKIQEILGINIILANEKAFSQQRSPFATIAYFSDYVASLIEEESAHV